MAAKKFPTPATARILRGSRLKSVASNSVIRLREAQSLPAVDEGGIFPLAFLRFVQQRVLEFQAMKAAGAIIPSVQMQGTAPLDPVVFAAALAAFPAWRSSPDRLKGERVLDNLAKRCVRRAKARKFATYAEKTRVEALQELFQPSNVSSWLSFVLWGFALRLDRARPSLLFLKELTPAYEWHAHGTDPLRVRAEVSPLFEGWRKNVYRLRAANTMAMTKASLRHFDALRHALSTRSGIVRRAVSRTY